MRGPGGPEGIARHGAVMMIVATLVAGSLASGQQKALPARLESYLDSIGPLSAAERTALGAGQPVIKLLEADKHKEVAVLGAIWIAAPIRQYIDAVEDIEHFEKGRAFRLTKRISATPRLDDFDGMRLSDEDLDDLRTCRVGDCEIKLGEQALDRFRKEIDWKASTAHDDANALMRQLSLDYVTRYLQGGNEQLAVYRDNARPTFVAQELRAMIDGMPELTTHMPNLRRYLLEYPRVTLPDVTSFLYWQETEFGLKPTIRISHLTIREGPEDTVVASKMLYASHYFWTGLEIRALVPDPSRGTGFWFVTVNRCRSDGLSGLTGMLVRSRLRREVKEGALAAVRMTKRKLEGSR